MQAIYARFSVVLLLEHACNQHAGRKMNTLEACFTLVVEPLQQTAEQRRCLYVRVTHYNVFLENVHTPGE